MATKLYVGNLPFDTTNEDLQAFFAEIGPVVSAQVVMDRETGRSRGFGFVEMSGPAEAAAAVERFDQTQMRGRTITVNEARPRADRPERGSRGGHDRGSRDY